MTDTITYGVFSETNNEETLYRITDTVEEAYTWLGRYTLYCIFGEVPEEEFQRAVEGLLKVLRDPKEGISIGVSGTSFYVRAMSLEELQALLLDQ